MKVPNYIIRVQNEGDRKGEIFYNTLTGAKMFVNENQLSRIKNGKCISQLEFLKDKGFIIEDNCDEDKITYKALTRFKPTYNLTLITTYDCNMMCPYCFEENTTSSLAYMDITVGKKVIERIENKIVNDKIEKLNIAFTGGEPLLNFDIIENFLLLLTKLLVKYDKIIYNISLITNGTLLNDYIVNQLKKYNLKGVQVTVDGIKSRHDGLRPSKDGTSSFDKIINSIEKYAKVIPFAIRTNYHYGEENILLEWIDYLDHNMGDYKKNISLKFRNIMDTNNYSYSRNKNSNTIIGKIFQYGFNKGFNILEGSICDKCRIHSNNSEYIDCFGDIYRCFMFAGNKNFVIGNINELEYNEKKLVFDNLKVWENCIKCPLVAICAGGCRYEALVSKGNINKKVCDYQNKLTGLQYYLKSKYKIS
ncbi:radical SAM/SPASM domain-containing protein [Vallitalea maricola]|uniref:4Fe-4S cluster-binding domain-containing protein n=1 Tax=Vallitalea maricola TaxID=3074433 RepID=A0ACB5UN54_9FIRM|nr:4Fe-4S cluster-binding domain-containing protein [Vallitalea sp. AN17-2]